MARGRCPRSTGKGSLQQRVLLLFLTSGLRESLLLLLVGVLQCHCVILWSCVHLHNEGIHRGLLSRRGLLVRPTLLGVSMLVSLFCRLALTENQGVSCHCHTLLPFTCAHDFLSLWASSPASQCHSHCGRLRVRVLVLTLLSCIARGLQSPRF